MLYLSNEHIYSSSTLTRSHGDRSEPQSVRTCQNLSMTSSPSPLPRPSTVQAGSVAGQLSTLLLGASGVQRHHCLVSFKGSGVDERGDETNDTPVAQVRFKSGTTRGRCAAHDVKHHCLLALLPFKMNVYRLQ